MPKRPIPKTRTLVYSDRIPSLINLHMYPVGSQIPRGDPRVDGDRAPTGQPPDLAMGLLLENCCAQRERSCRGKLACQAWAETREWRKMTLDQIWDHLTAIHRGKATT